MLFLVLFIGLAVVIALVLTDRYFRARSQSLRASGLYPAVGQGTDADVVRLAEGGHKIEAIKLYREIHGGGLKEAKQAVEALAAEAVEGRSEPIEP